MAKWVCPGCRKSFEIPEGWENPKFCADCRELAKGGPPKAPVPPKPIPEIVLIDESGAETPAKERRFPVAIVVRVAAVIGVVAVVVSAFAYNRAEYRNLERAWKESRELDRKQDEIVERRREDFFASIGKPKAAAKKCIYCDGTGKPDCEFCINGKKDCAACSDGTINFGTHVGKCPICFGKKVLDCEFCNGDGFTLCAHCNGTGVGN